MQQPADAPNTSLPCPSPARAAAADPASSFPAAVSGVGYANKRGGHRSRGTAERGCLPVPVASGPCWTQSSKLDERGDGR